VVTAQMSADRLEGRFLEDEHARLRHGLAMLHESIANAHHLDRLEAVERITRVLIWLRRDLLPHLAWEEAWLYPQIDLEAGSPWATRALHFEHQQIRELAQLLEVQFGHVHERWGSEVAFGLVASLARLEALITAHVAQEDRFVVPMLNGSGTPTQH
jgi:iron-sulfur cluster repair protein YtfE (RIC family)